MDKFEAVFDYITMESRKVVVQTDLNAPMSKLITVDLDSIERVSHFLALNVSVGLFGLAYNSGLGSILLLYKQ